MSAPFSSVLVVGYGLIGASVVLAARRSFPSLAIGIADTSEVLASVPLDEEWARRVDVSDRPALKEAATWAECVILATPVRVIERELEFFLEHAEVVTDCGSTKRSVVETARRSPFAGRFVPGHPMAGRPVSGFRSAQADLFEGRNWILCPGLALAATEARVSEFLQALGATVMHMSPDAHDEAVALTSHLPQLIASLLATMSDGSSEAAEGPGFRSATRVAGGDERMWGDIFATNADKIALVAARFSRSLGELAGELAESRVDSSLQVLRAARQRR